MINAFQSLFNHFNRANLSPLASPRNTKPDSSPERSPVQKTPETVTPRVKSLTADGSPATGNQTWGPPRTVELEREQGKSLGISIVGQCLLYNVHYKWYFLWVLVIVVDSKISTFILCNFYLMTVKILLNK